MSVAALRSDTVYDGATANAQLPVKFAKIDTAASADLIAAVTGKKLRVLGLVLVTASSVTVKLQSGGSTDLTGAMTVAGVMVWPAAPFGYVQTNAGEKLNVVLGGAVQTSGGIVYVEVG